MAKQKVVIKQPKRKLSVLEDYFERGLLGIVPSRWTPEYRFLAGQQLALDFYKSRLQSVSAINYEKDRVDVSASNNEPAYVLDARNRYNKAIKDVPAEFWSVVSEVCCFDKLIKGIGKTKQQRLYNRNMKLCDLCRGLDYVIKGYLSNGWRL